MCWLNRRKARVRAPNQVWCSGIDWDDTLNEYLNVKCSQWKASIPLISDVEIPRCYSKLLCDAEDVQLHTFKEYAYAAVSYLVVQLGERITVSLVATKCKVAPLKKLSMTLMELQAALIGVRSANSVQNIPSLQISSKHWWSDSQTVLHWLRIDPRNFHEMFLVHSKVTDWKWVHTKIYPADFATKIPAQKSMDL